MGYGKRRMEKLNDAEIRYGPALCPGCSECSHCRKQRGQIADYVASLKRKNKALRKELKELKRDLGGRLH